MLLGNELLLRVECVIGELVIHLQINLEVTRVSCGFPFDPLQSTSKHHECTLWLLVCLKLKNQEKYLFSILVFLTSKPVLGTFYLPWARWQWPFFCCCLGKATIPFCTRSSCSCLKKSSKVEQTSSISKPSIRNRLTIWWWSWLTLSNSLLKGA